MNLLTTALVSFSLSTALMAQEPATGTKTPAPVATEATVPATQDPKREAAPNPFAADDVLKQLFGKKEPDPLAFQPLADRPLLPEMRLRGVVQLSKAKKPAALVELTGFGTYTVREGETISFTLGARLPSSLRVTPGATSPAPTESAGAVAPQLTMTGEQRARQRALNNAQAPATGTTPTPGATGNAAGVVVQQQIPIVLRVERVAKDGVIVEIGTLGQYLIIR